MSFEGGLLQDLDDYERFLAWRSGSAHQEADLAAPVKRDLMLLHAETLKVAAFAAAATSLATYALTRGRNRSGRVGGSLFTAAFSLAAEQRMMLLPQSPELFDLHRAWVEVQAKLSFANVLARERATAEGALVIPLDLVADAWTRACEALLDWHQRLAALLIDCGEGCDRHSEASALRLLQQAAAGGPACIDPDGMLTLPGWAERRRETRRATAIDVTTMVGFETLDSVLENISQGGLKLAIDAGAPAGTPVAVTLPRGRVLTGHVRWAGDGKMGVELDEPLADDDPLWVTASFAGGH